MHEVLRLLEPPGGMPADVERGLENVDHVEGPQGAGRSKDGLGERSPQKDDLGVAGIAPLQVPRRKRFCRVLDIDLTGRKRGMQYPELAASGKPRHGPPQIARIRKKVCQTRWLERRTCMQNLEARVLHIVEPAAHEFRAAHDRERAPASLHEVLGFQGLQEPVCGHPRDVALALKLFHRGHANARPAPEGWIHVGEKQHLEYPRVQVREQRGFRRNSAGRHSGPSALSYRHIPKRQLEKTRARVIDQSPPHLRRVRLGELLQRGRGAGRRPRGHDDDRAPDTYRTVRSLTCRALVPSQHACRQSADDIVVPRDADLLDLDRCTRPVRTSDENVRALVSPSESSHSCFGQVCTEGFGGKLFGFLYRGHGIYHDRDTYRGQDTPYPSVTCVRECHLLASLSSEMQPKASGAPTALRKCPVRPSAGFRKSIVDSTFSICSSSPEKAAVEAMPGHDDPHSPVNLAPPEAEQDAPTRVLDSLTLRARGRVGSTLRAKWRLDQLLGVGGMAAVYAATHRNSSRVAVKLLHFEVSANPEIRSRFMREGYAANSVGHPGAVQVIDDDVAEDGSLFLVTELLDGETLEDRRLRFGGRLPEDEVLAVFDQVLDVLIAAHAKGIVHRDIKPENVFLTRSGQVKVLDFGIARLREVPNSSIATQGGSTIGTPSFMPPEQARGLWDHVDGRSDLWACGATMFVLLSGLPVHHGRTPNEVLLSAMTNPAPRIASVLPGVPAGLAHAVDRALAFDHAKRWPDARRMQEAIRHAYYDRTGKPITTAPKLTVPQPTLGAREPPLPPRPDSERATAQPVERRVRGTPFSISSSQAAIAIGGVAVGVIVSALLSLARDRRPSSVLSAVTARSSGLRAMSPTVPPPMTSASMPTSASSPIPLETPTGSASGSSVPAVMMPEVAATDLPLVGASSPPTTKPPVSVRPLPNVDRSPAPPPPSATSATSATAHPNCDPPYEDIAGRRHWKRECFGLFDATGKTGAIYSELDGGAPPDDLGPDEREWHHPSP